MRNREQLLNITSAVYRITGLLPEKEPLVFLIRQKSVEIMAGCILDECGNKQVKAQIFGDIAIINSYFQLAKTQHWINNMNFSILQGEYSRIKQALEFEIELSQKKAEKPRKTRQETGDAPSAGAPDGQGVGEKQEKQEKKEDEFSLDNLKNDRHKQIIGVLKQKEQAQVKDLESVFPGVSKRTLRRDMSYLFDLGYIKRYGDANNTVYKIVVRTDRT